MNTIFSKRLLQILMLLAVSLSSCQSSSDKFPTVAETFVSPASLPEPYRYYGFDYILSYDGKSVWLSSIEQFDLASGKIDTTFIDGVYKFYKGNHGIQSLRGSFAWSVDGRYLATTSQDVDTQNDIIHPFVYLTDTQEKTVTKIDNLESFSQWSPINNEIMFASSHQAHVWDRANALPIPQWQAKDFMKSSELVGNRDWLWDKDLNLPIAHVDFKPITDDNGQPTGKREGGIASYDPPNKYTFWQPIGFILNENNFSIGVSFDPSGKFLLIGVSELENALVEGETYRLREDVKDTVLMLINWRTKEKTELFRLSSFDPQHVIATDIAWSGDGSTILVLRKDTSPLVLKIEYP